MKAMVSGLFILVALCFLSTRTYAVVAVKSISNEVNQSERKASNFKKGLSLKKQKKFKKKIQKFKRKLKRNTSKRKKAAIDADIIEDGRFRLGVVVFAAGLAVLLIAALFIGFGGFIIWVGRLAALIGLILMVWALIENS